MVLGILNSHTQKNETVPLPYTILKNQLKWIKDLNLRAKAIKLCEENWE